MKNFNQNQKKVLLYSACLCVGVVILTLFIVILTRPEDPNAKGISTVSQGDIAGEHVYQVYSDNFTVDADITAPYNETADVLYAKSIKADEKLLLSMFFKGKNPKRETASYDANLVSYNDGNASITISPANKLIVYSSDNKQLSQIAFPTENLCTKYNYWDYFVNATAQYDTVYKKENLNFMTRDKAVDYAYSVLQELKVDVLTEETEVYAIDHETMQEYQDKLKAQEPDSALNYNLKDKFTEDDDFYILCFSVIQNQIPLTHCNYWWGNTRFMFGTNIKMYISKNGITYFSMNGVYQTEGIAESSQKVITVQEAMHKAFEVYNSVITTDKATVDEIRFEYAPIPYNSNDDEVKLTPVWTLHLSIVDADNFENYQTILIDAITGEKIN